MDWTEYRSVPLAVVDAIADATDRRAVEVPPLQEEIDADSLERLFDAESDDVTRDIQLSFVHADTRVVISGDGTVVARATYL